jgi:hypothetical protein
MQDELILNQAIDEINDVQLDEISVSIEEDTVDAQVAIEQHIVDAEETEVVEINVSEGFTGDTSLRVTADHSRYLPDQHTIGAITGLREELDEIERLKTVYSNEKNQANYYLWEDENPSGENRNGYFVSVRRDDNRIRICTAAEDEFGVTVSSAGLVGGQDVNVRDIKYGLVVHSGVVGVRCETDVEANDYVISDDYGIAKKTDGTYGYLVTAISKIEGIKYAIVSLTMPSTQMQKFSEIAQDVNNRMEEAEINIATAISVANAAYNKAKNVESSTNNNNEFVEDKIEDVLGRVDDMEGQISVMGDTIGSVSQLATQAYAISNTAAITAENIRKEAVGVANEAHASVSDLMEDVAPITTWTDPKSGNVGAEYLINHMNNDLATKTEIAAVETLAENNFTAISQNAENIELLATSIDKYSVGELSQAYGLTWEQAKSILKKDMIYIPTVEHDEMYADYPTDNSKHEFTREYYYTWNGYYWVESKAPLVYFSNEYVYPSTQCEYWYRETDEELEYIDPITGDTVIYEAQALYVAIDGKWVKVNILDGNVTNRVVSAIKQTANQITIDVANARGDIAALQAKVDDGGATMAIVASVVTVFKDVDGNPIDITGNPYASKDDIGAFNTGEYYAVGTAAPYDIYTLINGELVKVDYLYYDGVNIMKPNTASIINAANNEGDTSIALNADKINFDGVAIFAKDNSGITTITGSIIQSGYIASHNVSGIASTENIVVNNETMTVNNYDITKGMLIDLSQGSIHTPNFTLDSQGNVSMTGRVEATSGFIGSASGFQIYDMGLCYRNIDETIGASITPAGIQLGDDKISITNNGHIYACGGAHLESKNQFLDESSSELTKGVISVSQDAIITIKGELVTISGNTLNIVGTVNLSKLYVKHLTVSQFASLPGETFM